MNYDDELGIQSKPAVGYELENIVKIYNVQ